MKLPALAVCALVALAASAPRGAERVSTPRFTEAWPLDAGEGVFAYARISPDGRLLAYASERSHDRNVTVVDLQTKKVLFSERGIDAYWSTDGTRMIYLSYAAGRTGVTVRVHATGELIRNAAPAHLGDYYSWARRDGRDLILTINSNYYYLDANRAVLPHASVPQCDGIGQGQRPLISRDGRRISTFVRGEIVVRGLDNCDDILRTGARGGKADFSFDGRYLAFHVQKQGGRDYELQVVDLEKKTVRTVTDLPGSSFFPSWTRDGRLSFRYDSADYRGFMFASDVLSAPERPLATIAEAVPESLSWRDVFPETPQPVARAAIVTIWSSWSAHSPDALLALEEAAARFRAGRLSIAALTALEPASWRSDADALLARHRVRLPEIPLAPSRLVLTGGHNQMPATLLFIDGRLEDRRLGAQTAAELKAWVSAALNRPAF